ncbi:phosphoglycerate dehydrogenase [Hazenella sp. IB182353]|uniref:phosphoglycerate dehydrogenase n=1 Tax=Polycladospora coralii TaxID=2771432 RepID=UPI0017466604|nr:phosphoglycerate dehydrogenase [Polycladospora coralii]MBS7529125.1 phosphoglycerate dehydrogenase [Polycladospora coralii]
MHKVYITDPLSDQGIEKLLQADDIEVIRRYDLTPNQLLEEIADADALLVRSQTQVTEQVIAQAPRLKVIARAGVGVDNIDIPAATQKGVIVVNAPDGNTISTAEHTFAMLLSLSRNIPQAYHSILQGKWNRKAFVGIELKSKTLSIIGLGRIGAELAKRAKAFRMEVMAYDPYLTKERAEELGVKKASFDEAIRYADYITVHTPLTKETKHFINADTFQNMKQNVRILNCARGGIIDETALYEAIKAGKVAGAALDVFEDEPPIQNPLLELPQVIATPHLGASTIEAQENVAIDVSEEVIRILRNQPFKNAVNLPSVPAELQQKLQPYQELAEKLGSFLAQITPGAPTKITFTYAGEITALDIAPLTRTILKGLLSHSLASVNDVNAPHLAQQRGIQLIEQKTSHTHGFTQIIHVEMETSRGSHRIAGTLINGFGARITKIDDYSVDVTPRGNLLYIRHQDIPGAIGKVGMFLGQQGVNIATMQVGRLTLGGQAIMVLRMDRPLTAPILNEFTQIPNFEEVIEITL